MAKKGYCERFVGNVQNAENIDCGGCEYADGTGGEYKDIVTNYDRIKSMSVEEMAELIVDFHFVFQCKSYGLDPKTTYENMNEEDKKKNKEWEEEMRPIWERWLLQEVSENDTTRKES